MQEAAFYISNSCIFTLVLTLTSTLTLIRRPQAGRALTFFCSKKSQQKCRRCAKKAKNTKRPGMSGAPVCSLFVVNLNRINLRFHAGNGSLLQFLLRRLQTKPKNPKWRGYRCFLPI